MYNLYKVFSYVIYPLLPILLFIRQLNGKEDDSRKGEKLGKIKVKKPKGKLLWIHCASVGEANSSLALISELLKDKKLNVLMTTGTLSSANLMGKKLPKRAIHQFNPLDTPQIVNRFLNHWKPDSVLWTESEIWPNTLAEIKKRKIPAAAINATISEKSYKKWLKHKRMIKEMLSTFSVCLAQTSKKATMLKKLGAKNVKCVGNLKFTTPTPEADVKKLKELKSAISKRKVMCYSSTHKGEEEIAIGIHKNLSGKQPMEFISCNKKISLCVPRERAGKKIDNLLSIIIPRHPARKEEIKTLLVNSGLNFAIRSEGALPDDNTDVYVADTFGEMGTFYSACSVVFMGGSLTPYHEGGHNPIEPAKFGCAVLSGDRISCFETIYESLKGATKIVSTKEDLQKNIADLMSNKTKVNKLSKNALKITGKDNTILEDIIVELKKAKVV